MAKAYEALDLEVIRFSAEDVIMTSGEDTSSNDDGYTLLETSSDGDLGLYLGPDGHYYVKDLATGEILSDLGTEDPRETTPEPEIVK